jgi:DNA-binding transcriptional MerR regulator
MQSFEQTSFPLGIDVIWIEHAAEVPTAPKAAFSIGELAAEFGVTPRALRFYESRGLISPLRLDGMRSYTRVDRDRLALILRAKKLGFSLLEISGMIEAQEGRPAMQSLKFSREKCSEQIDMLERQRKEMEEALVELRRIHTILSNSSGAGDKR